jgi:hypothetical protein
MKKLLYLFSCVFAALLVGCEPTEPPTSNKIETGASENITESSATVKGVVNVDISAYNSIEFGIMYDSSLDEVKNRSAHKVKGRVLHGTNFSVDIAGLSAKTKYYYCAYVLLNNMQYEYGEVKSFTTLASSSKPSGNSANGHAYVDLGLSVKWATCNVGANSPEEYGDYFAWGETKPKDYYDWDTYKWCNGNYMNFTKYCTVSVDGKVDNKTVLDLTDDAAHVNWGGAWRMPTLKEQQELLDNCKWKWTTQNGVQGCLVTSNKNGNSIFLPATGYRVSSEFKMAGAFGNYWSSTLYSDYISNGAYVLDFGSIEKRWSDSGRFCGLSVRPVLP